MSKIALLLVNLGTPDGTDYWSMRRYLREFLSDRRVVEMPRFLWHPILHGIILTLRPSRSGKAYDLIWNKERGESPLRTITRDQSDRLAGRLADKYPELLTDWAMRYGQPSIGNKIVSLMEQGAEKILLFPLYPQYSASTTASMFDKTADQLAKMRAQPAMRFVPPFADDPAYIKALAKNLGSQISALEFAPKDLLLSFHGLPQDYVLKGDPYQRHCQATYHAVREEMRWPEDHFHLSFQSRMGRAEWIRPYTDKTLASLAQNGVCDLAVAAPGFLADCVETLEEIAHQGKDIFLRNGGSHFSSLSCLNASDEAIDMLETIALRELSGWL